MDCREKCREWMDNLDMSLADVEQTSYGGVLGVLALSLSCNWQELPPMLARRTYASASELDGKIFIIGGRPEARPGHRVSIMMQTLVFECDRAPRA